MTKYIRSSVSKRAYRLAVGDEVTDEDGTWIVKDILRNDDEEVEVMVEYKEDGKLRQDRFVFDPDDRFDNVKPSETKSTATRRTPFDYKGVHVDIDNKGQWIDSNGHRYMSYLTPDEIKIHIDRDVGASYKSNSRRKIFCGAAISKSKENELRSALYKILKRMWMGETRSKTIKDFDNSDYRALHKYVYEHKTDLFNSKYLQDKIWDYANKQDNSDTIARAMIKMYDGMSENDFKKALDIRTDYKK